MIRHTSHSINPCREYYLVIIIRVKGKITYRLLAVKFLSIIRDPPLELTTVSYFKPYTFVGEYIGINLYLLSRYEIWLYLTILKLIVQMI